MYLKAYTFMTKNEAAGMITHLIILHKYWLYSYSFLMSTSTNHSNKQFVKCSTTVWCLSNKHRQYSSWYQLFSVERDKMVQWPNTKYFRLVNYSFITGNITNIYKNLQIVWSQFFTDMLLFVYIRSTGLLVFRLVANEYQWIAIQLLLAIRNIRSAIWWAIMKVILNYSCLLTFKA